MPRSITKTQADHQHAIVSIRVSTSGQGRMASLSMPNAARLLPGMT